MNIKEIEELSGLPRSGIRYYEAEGLLEPLRLPNGYRDYSEADLQTLLKIKRLRGLGLTLAGIRRVQAGESSLADELREALERLGEQRGELSAAEAECRWLLEHGADWDGLLSIPSHPALPDGDELLSGEVPLPSWALGFRKPGPWRRWFARCVDTSIWMQLIAAVLVFVFRLNPNVDGLTYNIAQIICVLLLTIAFEPMFLARFGTTPGKALMGIRIHRWDGGLLSEREVRVRTLLVLWRGEALYFSPVTLFTYINAYITAKHGMEQSWDREKYYVLTVRPCRRGVTCALAGSAAVLLLSVSVLLFLLGHMPSARGERSALEFANSYNSAAKFETEGDTWQHMHANPGSMGLKFTDRIPSETFGIHQVLFRGDGGAPVFSGADDEDGVLRRVEFTARDGPGTTEPGTYGSYMELSVIAYIWGREGAGVFDVKERAGILQFIRDHPCESFEAEWCGVRVTCEFSLDGYVGNRHGMRPAEGAADPGYMVHFVMEEV